jgi:hypothetical protein
VRREWGVFVGGVPLLERTQVGARSIWSVRPPTELNEALSARYLLLVDVSAIAPDKAIVVLQAIDTKDISRESFEAWWTLDQWGRGEHALA